MTGDPYVMLEQQFRRIGVLGEASAMLHWDAAAMMPPGGAQARSTQLATLDVMCHEMLTAPHVADLLQAAEADPGGLGDWQAANLREMRRSWRHATALDAALVERLSEAASTCELVWRAARADNDFARLRPHLETMVALVREKATAKAAAFGVPAYDALLDEYEPGLTAHLVDRVFDDLAAFLPTFLAEVLDRQSAQPQPLPLPGPIEIVAQRRLAEELMQAVGFDFSSGRLDVSHHPFTGGVPDDIRLTTRYDEDDVASALMAALHETGHAMYDRGLPSQWRLQPVGDAMGMAVHESQSLIVEMQACRSDEFLAYLAGRLRNTLGVDGPAWDEANVICSFRQVRRSLIRVDADEVTYPLHVILRYRLERALISGDLAVADLPDAWSQAMTDLVGVTPPDDRDGCMQDIHWMGGDFGYFPTYTLGAIAAAQLFSAAVSDRPDIPERLAAGDFSPLMSWLAANVHCHGAYFADAETLLTAVTGRGFDVSAFKTHLRRRYLPDT